MNSSACDQGCRSLFQFVDTHRRFSIPRPTLPLAGRLLVRPFLACVALGCFVFVAGCQKAATPAPEYCDADFAPATPTASATAAPDVPEPVTSAEPASIEPPAPSSATFQAEAALLDSTEGATDHPAAPSGTTEQQTNASASGETPHGPADASPNTKPNTQIETPAQHAPAGAAANHLSGESSPYLRMHVHNPVDWYPWGDEALKKARDEKKLIFLSVGYSSCYWCHVMERESFMDEEIARFLNEHFVCIKVDREERPDVDSIYMLAVQLITRRGGWPMSVFLTPDGEPFFGGTYFPARNGDRPGSPGFLTVIQKIHGLWSSQPELARETAAKVTQAVRTEMQGQTVSPEVTLDASLSEKLQLTFARDFDPQYGGFGFDPNDEARPKFPEASNLVFLLDCVERTGNEDCRRMLLMTLERMAEGGIWDHVGGGFHRYSTDRSWTIPHFEKMLYDNGQLMSVYARAYQLTKQDEYRSIVDQIAAWLQREMLQPEGGYAAALDAESEREEGKYYRWTNDELKQVLADDYARWASYFVMGPDEAPNFEEKYVVLRLRAPWSELATKASLSFSQLDQQLAAGRSRLLHQRDQRIRPLTDQKVLCSWNGLVVRGLADAGRYTGNSEHTTAAARAAEFILQELRGTDGRLLRTYSAGQAKLTAYLDDYAFAIDGLIALHQATGDARWLNEADQLMQAQLEAFEDPQQAGFFYTARDHESPLVRAKLWSDEAIPAGNSVSAANLLYLAKHLERPDYKTKAERLVLQATPMLQQYPRLAPRLISLIAELQ